MIGNKGLGIIMKELDYKALGARIKKARNAKYITQEQLGEMCSLSTAHIGHIERGTRIPSVDTLFRISSALDVSADYLLFDSADNRAMFSSIASALKGKDEQKIKSFMAAVRALADNIDTF